MAQSPEIPGSPESEIMDGAAVAAGHPDRRRDRGAHRVLAGRYLTGRRPGLGLDFQAAAERDPDVAVGHRGDGPLSLVLSAGDFG